MQLLPFLEGVSRSLHPQAMGLTMILLYFANGSSIRCYISCIPSLSSLTQNLLVSASAPQGRDGRLQNTLSEIRTMAGSQMAEREEEGCPLSNRPKRALCSCGHRRRKYIFQQAST